MNYQYFTQKLVNQNILDLTQVFPEKMGQVKASKNIDYGIPDIVLFLKQKSANFTIADQYLMDLDYGIREIIDRYYASIEEENPFLDKNDMGNEPDKFRKGQVRRDAVTIEPGKPSKKKEKEKPQAQEPAKKKKLTKEEIESRIEGLKFLLDDPDIAQDVQDAIEALEVLLP